MVEGMTSSRVFLVCLVLKFLVMESCWGFAQHPGAYSSPHYAKKNYSPIRTYQKPSVEYTRVPTMEHRDDAYQRIDAHDQQPSQSQLHHQRLQQQQQQQYQQVPTYDRNVLANGTQEDPDVTGRAAPQYQPVPPQSGGFMSTAGSFLSGRGGQMLADIAREMIVRSTGATSQVSPACAAQVLSLNLTNLVILVVLKALILAAGMFGAGAWHREYARSLGDDNNATWIDEKELALWQGYLRSGAEDYSCLARASCEHPELALRYHNGAEILLAGARVFRSTIPYDNTYEKIAAEMKEAAKWGLSGMNCERYKNCAKN